MATSSLHKRCRRCHQLKPLEELKKYWRADRSCWVYQHLCLSCHATKEAERRAFVERPLCACGCGEQVKYPGAIYRFGHKLRVEPKEPTKAARLTDGSEQPKKYERANKRKYRTCTKCGQVKECSEFDTYPATTYFGTVIRRTFSRCKDCARSTTQDYRRSLTGHARAEYLSRVRDYALRRKYGLTLEQFETIKQAQGDVCAVCERWRDRPHLDHCHKTGRIRGILCGKCNAALGMLEDDEVIITNLLRYIRSFKT